MNNLEILYAKLVFKLDTEKRMAISRKVASLLRNNFTLMDALSRIEMIESKNGRKPNEPFAIAMREIQKNLERGMTFSEATRGWVPYEETLLLMSGNVSSLLVSLENVGHVVEGIRRIKRAMWGAIAYPLFLLFLTLGIIVMVGIYLVPPLAEAAGSEVIWHGTAASLVWVSDFARKYWFIFGVGFVGIFSLVWLSLPIWTGKIRNWFDKLPPWNTYKLQASVSWLMSLAAMVSAGVSVPDAMRLLADNSNRYLSSILDDALHHIANGENLGNALALTGRNFPSEEIVGDLIIYADMNDFDKNVNQIARDYMEESVRKMENIANILNSVGIILVSVIIGWVVFGTFQMQEQITSAIM
ncbi:MAG: type II secretion system F family protein [Alphaproteobacteria bacterium]|nr:type II secretion system F family protein [Alphaproteobacteria bacterium]